MDGIEKQLLKEATPGMSQGGVGAPGDERVPIALPPGALLTDRMLLQIRLARVAQDQREGVLRDYPDGDLLSPTFYDAMGQVLENQHKRRTWTLMLLQDFVSVVTAIGNTQLLKRRLVELAATACSWAEGLEIRADDQRIAIEQKAMAMKNGKLVRLGESWLTRLLRKLRLVK